MLVVQTYKCRNTHTEHCRGRQCRFPNLQIAAPTALLRTHKTDSLMDLVVFLGKS